jgi:hypothetical protein
MVLNKLNIDQKDEFSQFLLKEKIKQHLEDILVNSEDEEANEYAIHVVIKVEDHYKKMIETFKEII